MKLCLKILAIAVIAVSTYSLIGCAAPPSFSYQNVTVSIASQCSDCGSFAAIYNPAYPQPPAAGSVVYMQPGGGQGGDILFVATVTNAPSTNVTWTIYPTPNLGSINNPPTGTSFPVGESGSSVGSISASSGNTALFAAPGSIPIYSGAALQQAQALGIPQGDILLVASVPTDPANPAAVATASQLIQMLGSGSSSPTPRLFPYTPTTPSGITAPAVSIARNATYQFNGFVVGALPCTGVSTCNGLPIYSVNNTPLWEVCPAPFSAATCVVGGNTTLGFITQTGLYTAPSSIPSPQPVVWVTSQAAPTISNTLDWANVGIY